MSVFVKRITEEKVKINRKKKLMSTKTKQRLLDRKLVITTSSNLKVTVFVFSVFKEAKGK